MLKTLLVSLVIILSCQSIPTQPTPMISNGGYRFTDLGPVDDFDALQDDEKILSELFQANGATPPSGPVCTWLGVTCVTWYDSAKWFNGKPVQYRRVSMIKFTELSPTPISVFPSSMFHWASSYQHRGPVSMVFLFPDGHLPDGLFAKKYSLPVTILTKIGALNEREIQKIKSDPFIEWKTYDPRPVAPPPMMVKSPEPARIIDPPISSIVMQEDGRILLKKEVLFDTGLATLRPEGLDVLEEIGKLYVLHPELTFLEIQGHADEKGSRKFNEALAKDRAMAVKAYLTNTYAAWFKNYKKTHSRARNLIKYTDRELLMFIDSKKVEISIASFGNRCKKVTGVGRSQLQLNRRVDFHADRSRSKKCFKHSP